MMTEKDILKIFKEENALLEGHFLLSSGLHSAQYMQCALLLQKPTIAENLCSALARKIGKTKVDAVIGPALGGVVVSYELARVLGGRSLFAERVDGQMALRRGFSLGPEDAVLIVEDVVTTGKSTREVLDLVRKAGSTIVGVASLVDRSEQEHLFHESFYSLLRIQIKSYQPDACPICLEGKIPLTKPGSRGLK